MSKAFYFQFDAVIVEILVVFVAYKCKNKNFQEYFSIQ